MRMSRRARWLSAGAGGAGAPSWPPGHRKCAVGRDAARGADVPCGGREPARARPARSPERAGRPPSARRQLARVWSARCGDEADVAAGMAQSWLASDPELSPSDIGILIENPDLYGSYLREAFGLAGLPLSGLARRGHARCRGRNSASVSPLPAAPSASDGAGIALHLAPDAVAERDRTAARNGDHERGFRPLPRQVVRGSGAIDVCRHPPPRRDSAAGACRRTRGLCRPPEAGTCQGRRRP